MSRENVEIVRRGFQAFNDRNFDAVVANLAEDVDWRLIGGFADLIENVGGRAEIESVFEVDDRIVLIVRTVGAGGTSGAPVAMRWGQVYTFRHGQVSEVDNYYDANDALAAVGLSGHDAQAT